MKRFSLMVLMVGFTTMSILAQQSVADKMYNTLRNNDDITYFSFSKNLIDFVDIDVDSDEGGGDEKKVTGDLKEIRVAIFKPDETPQTDFKSQVLKYLKKGDYEKVEDEDGDDTEVWINRKGRKVYECHVIFQGEKNGVLLSFFGDFKITDVDKLKGKIEDYK